MSAETGRFSWPQGFAEGPANRDALLVLTGMQGLTPRAVVELSERFGDASGCLVAVVAGRGGSDADRRHAAGTDPRHVRATLEACRARMVVPGTQEYPPGMLALPDPPAALFVRGTPLDQLLPGVAVVGSRSGSSLGRDIARALGRGLAASGITVVSGAARGIDGASHEGALLVEGGGTVAVLGSGIDVAYPQRNAGLLARIEASGAIVSEYPPGVPAEPRRFPARNRLIAAAGIALVIIEGAAGSGTLITCDHALGLGRPVYAVPGPVNSPLSEVPLKLIRDGATMIRGADDLLLDLGLAGEGSDGQLAIAGLTSVEEAVLAQLAGPTLPEHVARELELTVADVVPVLMQLELRGVVRAAGGRYERCLPG
ncbi:MAG: DNA-processing protein DprA [Actinomycetota bacterium]